MTSTEPQTFAERLRGIMSWMLFGAGVACTLLAVGALMIVWRGGWPAGTETQRLTIIGWTLIGALIGMLAVIVSLAIGGPVGRFKGKVNMRGAEFEAVDDVPPPVATVTTTTSVATPTSGVSA